MKNHTNKVLELYGKSRGKVIHQKSELDSTSKNIINSSIDIIMENDEMIQIFNICTTRKY